MMPRHRIEREPRHRARRPAQERPRRVQLRAVSARPAGHRRPGNGVSIPWQAIGSAASARVIALGARFRPYRQNLLTGAVRGLVVSPWFAAGAGFVVATGAFMYAPHAQLSFANPLIGRSPCKACSHDSTTMQGAQGLPAGSGVGLPAPSPTPSPTSPTAGLTFEYTVTSHTRSGFHMTIAVIGKKAIGDWTFSFVIPGATDVNVLEATPVPPVTGTPTASATPGGSSRTTSPSPVPSPGSSASAAAAQGVDSADSLYLVVSGEGTEGAAAAPADGTFDGAPCNFNAG